MKVLQLSKLYPPFWGGIETVVYDIATEIRKSDVDVDVLCVSNEFKSSEEIIDNVKVYRMSSFLHLASVYLSFSYIYKWFKLRWRYDIVHIHMPNPLANLALFLFRPNCKLVVHWHSDIVKQKYLKYFLLPLQTWILSRADRVIVTSPNYAKHSNDLKKYLGKVEVIPIGISDRSNSVNDEYLSTLRLKYESKKVIFTLGRHVYYKGFSYLIDAANSLPDNFVILIGGTGELTEKLMVQVENNNLQDKVFFLGKLPDTELSSYYALCDVFCLPSIEKSEAFGVVQLEAMSFGKPVVSTNIQGSGVSWVNQDGVSGYISPVKDSLQLAYNLQKALSNLDSQDIRNYFTANFTKEIMIEKIEKLYKEILK
ncbi:glycosyltransferase [Vibrio vulnificus]|nr:glycosyltransferase [Vibrio vulnificus]EIZ1360379.1 glycosyltransferase [Vibrio vulnificus]